MENSPGKDLTLIVYDSPKPPRYLKVNKAFVWSLVFFAPLAIVALILTTLVSSYYAKVKISNLKAYEPLTLQKLREEKETLQTKVFELENSNEELSEKISAGASSPEIALDMIAQPLGFKNLTSKVMAKTDNFILQKSKDKLTLKFDLINNTPDSSKLSGFIIILQMSDLGITYYPAVKFVSEKMLIDYSTGESFFVSRFRPVIAEFKRPAQTSSARYKIYIFSRSGNLLSFILTDPFEIDSGVSPPTIQEPIAPKPIKRKVIKKKVIQKPVIKKVVPKVQVKTQPKVEAPIKPVEPEAPTTEQKAEAVVAPVEPKVESESTPAEGNTNESQ